MEEQVKFSFWKQAVIYGLIMTAIGIFLSLVFYFTNLYLKTWSGVASGVISIVVLVYLMILYRKEVRGGFASFGQMFSMSFTSSVIALILSTLFSVLMMHFIFPEMMDATMTVAEERLLNNPRIPEGAIDGAMERMEKSMKMGRQILFGILGGAFINAIICLIVSAAVKKDDPSLEG